MHRSTLPSLALAGLIGLSLTARPSEACSRVRLATIQGFQVLPAEGSRVPRSTSVWVRSGESGTMLTDLQGLRLFDERGKSVTFTTAQVRVAGEVVETLFVFKPAALLEANTSYRLELEGKTLTRFTTSEEVDLQPPLLPRPRVVDARGETVATNGVACSAPSTVTVELETPGEVNFLVPASSSGSSMPGTALAVGTGTELTAVDLPGGSMDLRVVAFDLSGNLAVSSERLNAAVPFASVGCTVGLGAPMMSVALGLLALMRRRR